MSSMSSTDESSYSDTSSDGPSSVTVAKAAFVLLKGLMSQQMPEVNPPCPIPKLTGAQWMHLTLANNTRCLENLRMSPDAFMHLHETLLPFGLLEIDKCTSVEALGMYI